MDAEYIAERITAEKKIDTYAILSDDGFGKSVHDKYQIF